MAATRQDLQKSHSEGRLSRRLTLGLFAIFAVWMLLPALTPVHIETFSATLQAIAIMLNRHGRAGLTLTDQAYPVNLEYLYMTKCGLVDGLQVFMKVLGGNPVLSFRLMMWVSTAIFILSSLSIVRRWNKAASTLLFAAFLLTPGLLELSFYYSDNLPSVALAMLAIAWMPRKEKSDLTWLSIGLLYAAAMLIRFDAILVAPAFALGMMEGKPKASEVASKAVCLVTGIAVVFIFAQILTPYRLVDSIKTMKLFMDMHAFGSMPTRMRDSLIGFFGYITPVLFLIGAIQNWRTHDWRWRGIWIVLPTLFLLVFAPKALETRMYLPLAAPALLLHAATGLVAVWEGVKKYSGSPRQRLVAGLYGLGTLALFGFVFFEPVSLVMRDGPRTPTGKIWTPMIWREWQHSVDAGLDDMDKLIASVKPGETVLAVTTFYNSDGFFRLQLLEHGYDIVPQAQVRPEYGNATEVFTKGDRTVLHLRTIDPYAIMLWYGLPEYYTEALQVMSGLSTLSPTCYQRAYLVNWGITSSLYQPTLESIAHHEPENPNLDPHQMALTPEEISGFRDGKKWTTRHDWEIVMPDTPWIPYRNQTAIGVVNIQPMTHTQVDLLRRTAVLIVNYSRKQAKQGKLIDSLEELRSKFSWFFGAPPR